MSSYSRRRFLEDSMFAATAALAAQSVPKILHAAERETRSPNEKLTFAIVGVNGQGNNHINQVIKHKNEAVITHICDADSAVGEKRCDEVAQKQGSRPQFVQDIRKLLEDKSIDCISSATPNHWHALVAIWSMQADKDVYIEKPVSHNVSEGRRMVQVARKYNKICQTGTQARSGTGVIEGIAWLQSGKIGEVKLARGLCYKRRESIGAKGEYSPPKSVDYDLWLGPSPDVHLSRPKLHYDWHWDWNTGNGDLGNQGIHQMDVSRWALGLDTLPNTVMSYGGRLGYEDAGNTPNTQVIHHDYGAKSIIFEVRGLPTGSYKGVGVGVILEAEEGYFVIDHGLNCAAFDLEGTAIKSFKGTVDHHGNFINAVRSRNLEYLSADIEEGHLSSALCHLGNISYRLGESSSIAEARERASETPAMKSTYERFVEHLAEQKTPIADSTKIMVGNSLAFDPAAEKFVNNSAADAMLTREYRAPFIVPEANAI